MSVFRPGVTKKKLSGSAFSSGFTLFELLVTISIIGILLAIGVVSFTTAQRSGRDARRRADLTALRNALEEYKASSQLYPANCTDSTLISSVLPEGYPVDPQTGELYTSSCNTTQYCICAQLERTGSGNANASNCTDYTAGDYYCVQNLQ